MAEPITKNKDIVVMYHGNCPDGFTAAWAAWKKFGDDVEYIPLHRYLEIPQIKNRIIYMLDYCPNNKADLDRLQAENKKLIVIDHHISEAPFRGCSLLEIFLSRSTDSNPGFIYRRSRSVELETLKHQRDFEHYRPT